MQQITVSLKITNLLGPSALMGIGTTVLQCWKLKQLVNKYSTVWNTYFLLIYVHFALNNEYEN